LLTLLLVGIAAIAFYAGRANTPTLTPKPEPASPPIPVVEEPKSPPSQSHDEQLNKLLDSVEQTRTDVRIAHLAGEDIPLHFRQRPVPWYASWPENHRIDDGKHVGWFEEYADLARRGHGIAAANLWTFATQCKFYPKTPEAQQQWLDKIRSNYAANGGARPDGKVDSLDALLAQTEERFTRCNEATDEKIAEALDLLKNAAETDPTAQLTYAGAIMKSDREESQRLYQSLWSEGYALALNGLSATSLAANIAWHAVEIAAMAPGAAQREQRELDALRNGTSPSAYDEAAKQAIAMLRSNPRCCVW
jgi:hypothetical protein